MKNLFKFTAAALALVAFASCSENDDLLSSKNAVQTKDFTSVLEFEVEEPAGLVSTRAARNANAGGFVFQADDQIRVYDEDLGKFDTYTFDTKFGREGATKLLKDPAYAIFPFGDVRKGYCDADGNHIAEIKIGTRMNAGAANEFQVIEYSKEAGSETKVGDNVLYQCNIPMWGTVEKIDDQTVKAGDGLKPLTGVLMLTLGKTLGNASWIRLSSTNGFLGGTFYANLDEAEPKMYVNAEDEYLDLAKNLYIDLRDVPSDKAVLYIPVIAGINDLVISRTTDTGDDPTKSTIVWTTVSNESGYTFKRNGWHKVDYTYQLAAETPEQISLVMAQLSNQTEDLNLDVVNALNLDQTQTQDWKGVPAGNDNTIYVPNMAAETITINIKNDIAATTNNDLIIVDADDDDPFTGTLVIKQSTKAFTAQADVDINLPKAKVVLLGNFAPTGDEWTFNNIVASELQFGDGTTATDIDVTGAGTKLGLVSTSIDILKGATIKGNIDATNAKSVFAPITIKGLADGDIDTKGDVNVELDGARPAITGKLTFHRGGTTCTLKQGYISEITNNFATLGEANDHEVTVKLDDANGITAIKTVTVKSTPWADSKITLTESTLSGKTISSAVATAIGTYTDASTGIYTASQFEVLHTKNVATPADVTIKLGNDLNMAKAEWTAPFCNDATAYAFTLQSAKEKVNHTIKNLSYNKYASTVQGIGLVGNAAALTLTDITLDNVQFTAEYFDNKNTSKEFKVAFVGGVAGIATGAVDFDRVTVNLANNFGYSAYTITNTASLFGSIEVNPDNLGIGGFIGKAVGAVSLDQVNVKGALIQGYTCLGGFVGQADAAVSIDQNSPTSASKSDITAFKSNYSNPAATDIEMNYARIAAGVGYVKIASTPQDITIGTSSKKPTATAVAVTVPAGKTGRTYVSLGSGTGATLWNYAKGQDWIGFCGTETDPGKQLGTISINGSNKWKIPAVATGATAFTPLAVGELPFYVWTSKN